MYFKSNFWIKIKFRGKITIFFSLKFNFYGLLFQTLNFSVSEFLWKIISREWVSERERWWDRLLYILCVYMSRNANGYRNIIQLPNLHGVWSAIVPWLSLLPGADSLSPSGRHNGVKQEITKLITTSTARTATSLTFTKLQRTRGLARRQLKKRRKKKEKKKFFFTIQFTLDKW